MKTFFSLDEKSVAVTWDGTVEDALLVRRWGEGYGVEVEVCTSSNTAEIFLSCKVPLGRLVRVNSTDALVVERILKRYVNIYVVRGKDLERGADK